MTRFAAAAALAAFVAAPVSAQCPGGFCGVRPAAVVAPAAAAPPLTPTPPGAAPAYSWRSLPGVGWGWVHANVPAGGLAPVAAPVAFPFAGGCPGGVCR